MLLRSLTWLALVTLPLGPALVPSAARAEAPSRPWMNKALSPDARAHRLLQAMTLDEKLQIVHTRFGVPFGGKPMPDGALYSAGYAPGIPRLGIPPLQETDAGLGVANPASRSFDATALPSGLALGSTFDPALARAGGAMIGAEARALGFDVMLAGGADLTRDPRCGRNFEYIGEDPLLTGRMVGATIAGIQSRGVISTLKHFAVNDQETGRLVLSSDIDEASARESDLLAFEIALERGRPLSVMTAYNRVNGVFASENPFLIRDVLKRDWHYDGWVMSDWGSVHSAEGAVLAGLDQESGENLDPGVLFDAPLRSAVVSGRIPLARLDDMVLRILRARLKAGTFDDPPRPNAPIDAAGDRTIARTIAEHGIVLLKNDGHRLPLGHDLRHILVIGEHADFGVLSGGGSSQVVPKGALRLEGDPPGRFFGKPKLYDPDSPVSAIAAEAPHAAVAFRSGLDIKAAADAARVADVVILFAEQWMNEARDAPDLSLPKGQDVLIAAVAAANPNLVVVLETGGPVKMPWLDRVPALVEAWYPGACGGAAIAAILFGTVDPSGRLPISFPADETQLPRPKLQDAATLPANPGEPTAGSLFSVDYTIEGPDVGYKWFERTGRHPLFPFGYGLSYTRFRHGPLAMSVRHGRPVARFAVRNVGTKSGIDTPQLYVDAPNALFTRRLVGWARVALKPGERRYVSIVVDPRLLSRFDVAHHGWRLAPGRYRAAVRDHALALAATRRFRMAGRLLPP